MKILKTFLAAAGLALIASAASADVSVAFVNTAKVMEQAPQARAALDRLQTEFAPRQAEIANQQKSLKGLQEKLERDGAIMSESERSKLEREFVGQQREFKRAQTEFNEDYNLRRNDELVKLQREAAEAVLGIAKESGYDLVLEAGVVYASEKVDITEKVIARLRDSNARSPAGKSGEKK